MYSVNFWNFYHLCNIIPSIVYTRHNFIVTESLCKIYPLHNFPTALHATFIPSCRTSIPSSDVSHSSCFPYSDTLSFVLNSSFSLFPYLHHHSKACRPITPSPASPSQYPPLSGLPPSSHLLSPFKQTHSLPIHFPRPSHEHTLTLPLLLLPQGSSLSPSPWPLSGSSPHGGVFWKPPCASYGVAEIVGLITHLINGNKRCTSLKSAPPWPRSTCLQSVE